MTPNFEEILLELSYRIPQGIVDLTNEEHLQELINILKENGVSDANGLALEAKKSLEKLLATTFKNPETGNLVKVDSALRYKKASPAYKIASSMLDKSGYSEDDLETVDAGPDDEEKPNVFGKGKGANVFPSKPQPKVNTKPAPIAANGLNLKPEEVSKRTAALSHVIQKDFSPELKKSLGDRGIKTLVGGFEKMISGQNVNAQEKDLLQNSHTFDSVIIIQILRDNFKSLYVFYFLINLLIF